MTPSRLLSFAVRTPPSLDASDTRWLLGPSPAVEQLWKQLRRVAPLFRTAMLHGEPGSGAEYAARVLHDLSPSAHQPFVILSAADAEERFRARSQYATDGVLFIATLERLSLPAQNGLLHLLRRRGNHCPRVVAFTSRSLRTLVAANRFSAELANILGAIHIALPALRDRLDDIAPLAHTALHLSASLRNLAAPDLAPCLLDAARTCSWPGNIDQLRAGFDWLIETHSDAPTLYAHHLESALAAVDHAAETSAQAATAAAPRLIRLDIIVQEHIRSVLSACNGNKLRAAELLGISRSTLYRMLEQNMPAGESESDFAIAV